MYIFAKLASLWLIIRFADNFKKHGSKSNRDDWGRRRHDSVDRDREKDVRSYDPMEMLRERTAESEKYRERDSRYPAYDDPDLITR